VSLAHAHTHTAPHTNTRSLTHCARPLRFAKDCGAFESSHQAVGEAAGGLEKAALRIMGDDAKVMIGDMKATSLLGEMQKAERARYVSLEKLVERSITQSMDLEHLSGNVQQTIDDVASAEERVLGEVDGMFDRLVKELEGRRAEMRARVKGVSGGKTNALTHQKEDIDGLKKGMDETVVMAKDAMKMLHKEEYNVLIEPLSKHLELLGVQHKNTTRASCDDSSIQWVAGGGEQAVVGIVESMGAIHTSSDSLPGFEKGGEGGEVNDVVEKKEEGEGVKTGDIEMGRDIHLTVRALVPKNNGGLVGDPYHQAPPKDTVVVEVRKGSEKQVARSGVEGEVLGRVIIVNTIMNPPRDEYKVEQYFESLQTQTELHQDFEKKDKEWVKERRSKVAYRNVPTTRFTKSIQFTNEDSRWMKKLRREAAQFSWQKELISVEEGLSPRVDEALWKDKEKGS